MLSIPIDNCSSFNFGTREQNLSDACKRVKEQTGCAIEVHSNDTAVSFMITGFSNKIESAKQLLICELKHKETIEYSVPKEYHRHILGKKGAKLIDIQIATGTKITVPKTTSDDEIIVISGPKEYLDKAKKHIDDIINDRLMKNAIILKIPIEFLPFLQHKSESINNDYGIQIHVPSRNSENDEIKFVGSLEGIEAAKKYVTQYIEHLRTSTTRVIAQIPQSKYKYIIGREGKNLRDIMDKYGVSVEIPGKNDAQDQVTLRGPTETIGAALKDLSDKANSFLETYISAPAWTHRYLIGTRGDHINRIKDENACHNVIINFPSQNQFDTNRHVNRESLKEDSIQINGPPDQVVLIKEKLESLVKDILLTLSHETIKLHPKCITKDKRDKPVLVKILRNAVSYAQINGVPVRFFPEKYCLQLDGDQDRVKKTKEDLMAKIVQLENSKERDLVVEHFLHLLVKGEYGDPDSVFELQKKYDVRVKFFGINDDPSEVIRISGQIASVDEAYDELKKKVKRLQEDTKNITVRVFQKFFDHLQAKPGPGRKVLSTIMAETHTRIELYPENHVLSVVGTEKDTMKSEEEILHQQSLFLDTVTEVVSIPPQLHRIIIGPKGGQVKALEAEFGGVKINFPSSDQNKKQLYQHNRQHQQDEFNQEQYRQDLQQDHDPNQDQQQTEARKPDEVFVTGPTESVKRAIQKVQEIASDPENKFRELKINSYCLYYFHRDSRAGFTFDQYRNDFNVRILLPARSDKSLSEYDKRIITIFGKDENIENASKELEMFISGLEDEVEDTISVPCKYHRNFLKRGAELLFDLRDEYDVSINIPRGVELREDVSIKGPKIFVDQCKQEIESLIAEWNEEVTKTIEVSYQYHSSIKGPRGSKVNDLEAEFNVRITFPVQDSDTIIISGHHLKVDDAEKAILKLVPVTKSFDLAPMYIPNMMRNRLFNEIERSYDVKINVPRRGEEGPTHVIGVPSNVDKALSELNDALEQEIEAYTLSQLKNFQKILEVPREFHARLRGKRNSKLQQIEDDFSVIVKCPDINSVSSEVTIKGYEENVNEAEKYILSLVSNVTYSS